jgi:GNAT superfamily N-acetyltransferase
MTVAARRQRGADRPAYVEPACTYRSSAVLFGLLVVGLFVDVAFGGGWAHVTLWLVAIVVVVGGEALAVFLARATRSLVVTALEVRIGQDTVARERIVRADPVWPRNARVLGRKRRRARGGLALRMVDGSVVVVPTRHPRRLASVLAVPFDALEVRPAEPDELPALPQLAQEADSLFQDAGMVMPPGGPTVEELQAARVVLVAGRPPVGFAQVDELGGLAHLAELDVAPGRMRQGIGTALLEAACAWAHEHGYPAITLTTFAEVPWNAPFYAAHGFVEMHELSPELVEVRDWERARGLDALGRRIVMCRDLS